jgi:hypothetical protein
MPRTKKRGPITKEELREIRLENQRKLDEIMSIPNYIEVIARKYFGDDWLRSIDGDHPAKVDRQKRHAKLQRVRQQDENYVPKVPLTSIPIIQLDLEGNFVKEWSSIKEWKATEGVNASSYVSPLQCAKGHDATAYGYKWKFKKDYDNGK